MNQPPSDFRGLVDIIVDLINSLIPLLFGILFVVLVLKVIDTWVINVGDETKRREGKQFVIAAVIAFVVMLSAWGIVAILRNFIFG